MIVTPSNKLDAVNEILSAVGSSPVNSLEDELNVDVLNAVRILDSVSKEIQSRGWDFNIEDSVALLPDDDTNLVPCPNNYLRFVSSGYKLIRRSGYFFDILSQTNEFPEGLTLDTLVRGLDFEELPEVFRKFITCRAARIFQMRYLTSDELNNHLMTEESSAYADIIDYDLTTGNYNILNDDQYISQYIQRS
jgi:hypothetical protein